MKELSIEQKAKCYDEALERAKGVIEQNPLMEYLKKGIEYIFPELKEGKESEDERIRKALIHLVNSNKELSFGIDNYDGIKWGDILAWLEKQGKQETLCDKCRKEHPSHSCQDITALGRCSVEHEQKPAWSEENEFIINKILYICNYYEKSFEHSPLSRVSIKEDVNKIDNWLKSLKNKCTWKPTEEQMYNLSEAAHYDCAFFDREILIGLYDDLKQL